VKTSSNQLLCCMTPMEYEAGDSDDTGYYEQWMVCKKCGHSLDMQEASDLFTKRFKKAKAEGENNE
jgi:hypothetical protein